MAKGARKKTKWVLLTTATTTTVPPTEKEADTSSKLPWETKPRTSSSDCGAITTQNNSVQEQDRSTTNSSSFSNGYRTTSSSSHHYPSSHHRNYGRYYSGSSSKKSHYGHGGGSNYRSSSGYTAEASNEQTSSVTINEDEYTKITTPRQDVLFKKGYLSRPKKHLSATTSENGLTVNGSSTTTTTTDGSDIATGSGSVSTAESVTSDSTYLTDGLFMEPYPAPYPYFGYIDQSGVLVMNGFAVDSNGYSYMNGGQTYIYPPNYNLSQSQTFEEEEAEGSQFGGEVQQTDSTESELEVVGGLLDGSDGASANEGAEQTKDQDDGQTEEESSDQQMTPQQFLAPYANAYDYAQFYNNFYYPGCVMAPFPVVDNGLYYDQFETPSDDQFDFKKHRKWSRNWEEYPVQIQGDTMTEETFQDPSFLCTPLAEEPVTTTTEVPANATQLEPTQAAATSHKTPSQLPALPKTTEPRSQQQPNGIIAAKPKTAQSQKARSKRDLIESTRAFAEQNIDLSRPTYLQQTCVRHDEPTTWRTVCNGKEVAIEEDRAIESKAMKAEASKEVPPPVTDDQLVVIDELKPIESKAGKKESKRGKKTAKGKGKKQKRQNVSQQQQKGFEVIEPEFTPVSRIAAASVDEQEESSDVEGQEFEAMLNDDDSQTVIEAEADEELEQMLQDVQLIDIHVDVACEDQVEEAVEASQESDPPQVIENVTEAIDESVTVLSEDPPQAADNTIVPFDDVDNLCETCTSPVSCSVDGGDKEEEIEDFRHFSGEEDGDHVDSGVQSPAAFISPAVAAIEEKQERSYSSGSELHVTDAVTKWLSETLSSSTRLEEMFVLPENPALLQRIQQFHVLNLEDSLALCSDTYSSSSSSSGSSGDEADDADSDYMSDVQVKKAQKTESQKDQLANQTANGHPHRPPMIGDHSNCKQNRCIIM